MQASRLMRWIDWRQRRRAMRRRRAVDRSALLAEFQLERRRGIAAWRALAANVGELERARIDSHSATRRTRGASMGAGRS